MFSGNEESMKSMGRMGPRVLASGSGRACEQEWSTFTQQADFEALQNYDASLPHDSFAHPVKLSINVNQETQGGMLPQ